MSDNPYAYPSQGIDPPYALQGMDDITAGIALLERAAHIARAHAPLPPKVDAALGTLGLIAVRLIGKPMPDSAADIAMLARMVGE